MNKFENEYRRTMDDIHASDDLCERIHNLKPAKRTATPFITAMATVAAAIMITVVAYDYDFTPSNDGVISQTDVSTQMPEAEVVAVTEKPEAVKPRAGAPGKKITATSAPQAIAEDMPRIARFSAEDTQIVTENWDMEEYYVYIGSNPQEKINEILPVIYAGEESVAVDKNCDGDILLDTAVMNYVGGNGESITVTAAKKTTFNESLSGTVSTDGTGYKVSGDVYYSVTAENVDTETVQKIVDSL